MSLKRPGDVLRATALAGLLLAASAHAEVDSIVKQARDLVTAGQAAQAYALLEPHESARAGDPDFDLAFGMAANRSGEYARAVMALERLIAVQPNNPEARAELGSALYAVKDMRAARELLQQGKEGGVPAVAGETIDQLLHAIDRVEAEGKSSYRGYVEGTLGYDGNANGAPGVTSVAVPSPGGTTIRDIVASGLRRKAGYVGAGAGVSGRSVIDSRWSWIGNTSAYLQHFDGASQLDLRSFDANGGLSYRVERNEYSLVAQYGIYDIDGSRIRNLYGVIGEWTYRMDGFRQLNTYVQLSRLDYPQNHSSDADRRVVGITYAHLFRGGFWTYGGVYAGEEAIKDSAFPHLGHKVMGVRFGLQYPLNPTLGLFVSGGYESRRFGGQDPTFLVRREDDQANVGIGLSWVPATLWRVTPQYSYTRTDSTVPLSKYERSAYWVTVRREF